MKLLTFLLLILILGCQNQPEPEIDTDTPEPAPSRSMRDLLDTIAEPNDPRLLDMSKHQVFLDTTRTSRIYTVRDR